MAMRTLLTRPAITAALAVFVAAAAATGYLLASGNEEPAPLALQAAPDIETLARTDADIKVFKTATCGCCSSWVAHLRAHGFDVESVDVAQAELNGIKQAAGLDRELASCHTAFIDGYVIEGHVPAADVRRLSTQRPDLVGLSVPGMPIGSPGMEMGDRRDPFDVLAVHDAGETSVFNAYHR